LVFEGIAGSLVFEGIAIVGRGVSGRRSGSSRWRPPPWSRQRTAAGLRRGIYECVAGRSPLRLPERPGCARVLRRSVWRRAHRASTRQGTSGRRTARRREPAAPRHFALAGAERASMSRWAATRNGAPLPTLALGHRLRAMSHLRRAKSRKTGPAAVSPSPKHVAPAVSSGSGPARRAPADIWSTRRRRPPLPRRAWRTGPQGPAAACRSCS